MAPVRLKAHGGSRAQYVTREEFQHAIKDAGGDLADARPYSAEARRQAQRREAEALVAETFASSTHDQRMLAALAASDQATAVLRETLAAISAAEEQILGNIRNADTTGYKCMRCMVADGKLRKTIDVSMGDLEATNRPLDVAINGDGFFAVKILDGLGGVGYTRNGNFFVNNKGELVLGMGDGYRLVPNITVPVNATDVTIALDGTVTYTKNGDADKHAAGQILLSRFPDSQSLKPLGGSIYVPTDTSIEVITGRPGANGSGQLLSDFLEGSNIDFVGESLRLRWLRQWRQSIERAIEDHTAPSQTAVTAAR